MIVLVAMWMHTKEHKSPRICFVYVLLRYEVFALWCAFIYTYIFILTCSPGLQSVVTPVTDNVPPGCGIPEITLNSERSSIGEHYTNIAECIFNFCKHLKLVVFIPAKVKIRLMLFFLENNKTGGKDNRGSAQTLLWKTHGLYFRTAMATCYRCPV